MGESLGVLLAAGASTRMGRRKLSLTLGDEPLTSWSVSALLRGGVDRVRIVVPPDPDNTPVLSRFDGRVERIVNPEPGAGIASSIAAALRDLPDTADDIDTIVIALADMPFVAPGTIERLLEARQTGSWLAVVPVFESRQGHPVVWDRSLAPELRALRGDRGAKDILRSLMVQGEAVGIDVDDPGVCFDVDTPEDYERAVSWWKKSGSLR